MSNMPRTINEETLGNGILQGSPEWLNIRLGKLTASRVSDMLAKTRSGWGASRSNYRAQLVCERLTGQPTENYSNAAMVWGTEKEPEARQIYAFLIGTDVDEVGFIHHPDVAMFGCSPDGLVGADGLVEIKCPSSSTHIETLLSEAVPGKYVLQMQTQMACTGRAWCDFVSYDPRMPGDMQCFISRTPRDEDMIAMIVKEAGVFLSEVDAWVDQLKAKYRQVAA